MELLLRRRIAVGDAIPGDFFIDGKLAYFSLERTSKAIPVGRYRVRLTVSGRAARHELWSSDPAHRLPLVDGVPGRSGIRIHAGNEAEELEGCIALGKSRATDRLYRSQAAVLPFISFLDAAQTAGEDVWLTITPPGAPAPLKA